MRPCRARLLTFVVCVLAAAVLLRAAEKMSPASPLAPPDAAGSIVGGTVVDPRGYPWFVSLANDSKFCGGVLVGPNKVLTAKHCTITPGWRALIGGDEKRTVSRVEPHPSVDLAGVTLKTASKKKPIKLATSRPPTNKWLMIMGHGQKTGSAPSDGVFSVAFVQAVTATRAVELISSEPALTLQEKRDNTALAQQRHILTLVSSSGRQACYGDSGAPVMLPKSPGQPDDLLVGIVSRGLKDCEVKPTKYKYTFAVSIPVK